MTATEDPESQFSSAAAGADQPSDDLENWLSDLRTEAGADSSGWATEKPATTKRPAGREVERGPLDAAEPSSGGRHRAPE
jgi:hypothetical protein